MSEVKLSPGGERVMRALGAATVDPGMLYLVDLAEQTQIPMGSGLSKVLNRLEDDGLLYVEAPCSAYAVLTEEGVKLCRTRGWLNTAERT